MSEQDTARETRAKLPTTVDVQLSLQLAKGLVIVGQRYGLSANDLAEFLILTGVTGALAGEPAWMRGLERYAALRRREAEAPDGASPAPG